jgi:hypothetical protein
MNIKVGDMVWWRIRVGMFNRTLSGTVTEIDDKNMASVSVQTQNIYGAIRRIHVNYLNLKKEQR